MIGVRRSLFGRLSQNDLVKMKTHSSCDVVAFAGIGTDLMRRTRPGGGVRLKVHRATIKSIKLNVKSHRRRILSARRLSKQTGENHKKKGEVDDRPWTLNDGLGGNVLYGAGRDAFPPEDEETVPSTGLLAKTMSTDSDELEVDGSSEEDQDESKRITEELVNDVDSGCDEWDLCKNFIALLGMILIHT